MSTVPSLDTVKQQFDHWRATPNKNQRIPDYLWERVAILLDHYQVSKIQATLGLNSTQIKKHCQSRNNNEVKTVGKKNKILPADSFISIDLPSSVNHDFFPLELTRPDGITLHFKKIDHSLLTILLQSFFG
jgi:hypothetical protein